VSADTVLRNEFAAYLTRTGRDPKFVRAYERSCRRMWMSITEPLCINGDAYHRTETTCSTRASRT